MSVGVANRTLAEIVKEVLRLCGLIINEGTATAGSTTSLTDATNERTPTANSGAVTGTYLYIWEGTGVGDYHELTSYTIGVMTWAVAGTAPTTTSKWVRTRINPQRVIDAVAESTRKGWLTQAIPLLSEAIVTNNLLQHYGSFEEWASGASSAPDGWTLSGAGAAVARESVIIYQGTYSAKVTAGGGATGVLSLYLMSDGTNTGIANPAARTVITDGGQAKFLGFMQASNSTGDIEITVAVTNSANTTTTSTFTGALAATRWESIEDNSTSNVITIPQETAQIRIQCIMDASKTGYFDDLMLCGNPIYDYDIPASLIRMHDTIWMESGYRTRKFDFPLYYGKDWEIVQRDTGTTTARFLHFNTKLPSYRHLRISGFRSPDVQTTASSNVEPNPVWLAHTSAVRVMEQQRMTEETITRLGYLRDQLTKQERTVDGNTLLGAGGLIPVEPR